MYIIILSKQQVILYRKPQLILIQLTQHNNFWYGFIKNDCEYELLSYFSVIITTKLLQDTSTSVSMYPVQETAATSDSENVCV